MIGFHEMDCDTCGIVFYTPEGWHKQRADHGEYWYCPNGHKWRYGPTNIEKLEQKLRALREDKEWLGTHLKNEENSHRATRGQLTRAKKRAANGVCPCCRRSFANVRRHVKSQHPQYHLQVA